MLLNLLTNAINVSPAGGLITLRSELTNGLWRVAIEDEGPGLNAEQRVRIFDRFVRFNIPPEGDRGSGLGLAICQSIIELHGGRIFAEAPAGRRGLRVIYRNSRPNRPASEHADRPGAPAQDRRPARGSLKRIQKAFRLALAMHDPLRERIGHLGERNTCSPCGPL